MTLASIAIGVIIAGYMALHGYLYRKINAAFHLHWLAKLGLIQFFVVMTVAPFIARHLDHDGSPVLSHLINLPTFVWIAWLFWFCVGGLLLDLWNTSLRLLHRGTTRLVIPARRQIQLLCVLIVLTTAWSAMEASHPRIREITLHHPAFRSSGPLRLVQVSDVHLGMLRSDGWNDMICRTIRTLSPDILVSTGDLVDSSMKNIGDQADPWAAISARLGKFAVLGNHEYFLGLPDSLAFHRKAGFRLLRGETVAITEGFGISGVDDRTGRNLGAPCYCDESDLVPVPDKRQFRILLKHQPLIRPETSPFFNLQLSGHTHQGQLFPFHLFVRLFYHYFQGLYQPAPGFQLYVSAGTGTWGPPMRLFAPPEITVFTLTQ